jgi:hypothetical protein
MALAPVEQATEGGEGIGPLLPNAVIAFFDSGRTADPRTDDDPGPGFVENQVVQAGILHGHGRCGYCKYGKAVHALEGFFVDPLPRIEILHFGRQLRAKTGRVEMSNPGNPVFSGLQSLPECFHTNAHRGHCSQTGHHNPLFAQNFSIPPGSHLRSISRY